MKHRLKNQVLKFHLNAIGFDSLLLAAQGGLQICGF